MYRPFDEQLAVFSPSESVSFRIAEETESERNEDEISSSSPPHVNQDGRSIKPRKNNPSLAGTGSTDPPHTWYGTNADRELLRPISKDDSVLVMAEGHRTGSYNCWTCTFCSNENFGGNICDACNQERANLHSY
uniref:RanBP2-type domain-containing protein n=1 Tax=Amphimedon queenslandica TaxID=400682 RepID=A0A1X7SUQ7_AMPQE